MRPKSPKYVPGWNDGDNKACCDRCGRQRRASQLSKEWTGVMVCETCFETKHPQDEIKSIKDNQNADIISPRTSTPTELLNTAFDPENPDWEP